MVIANFTQDEKTKYVEGLDQYDYGQVLRIQGLNLPTAVEIHFGLDETGGTTVTRIGTTKDGVTDVIIPDSMLENNDTDMNYSIYAFVYLADSSSGKTTRRIKIQVKARPKPEAFDRPEDAEIFKEAIKAVNESAARSAESEKEAEGWAHGREDLPERLQDNAKYYSEQAREDSAKTDADRKEVGRLVESVSGIGEQVEKVEGLTKQTQTSATNAALSEQAAKESENNAAQARVGAEVAEDNAELAAQRAEQDKAIVEQAKNIVKQMGQEVLDNKNLVDETAQDFDLKAQQALADVNNAGQAQAERVQTAGNDAVESVKAAQGTATRAVETAKTEAIKAVQEEGTTQAGNVSAEGEKQVQAVRGAAQEIIEDREQIQTNKEGIAKLKEDIVGLDNRKADAIVETASGNPCNISDSSGLLIKKLNIYGESTQEGTPSPALPVPIISKEISKITVTGKELEKQETILSKPITLRGIPVESGGNVTIDGKQYVSDMICEHNGIISVERNVEKALLKKDIVFTQTKDNPYRCACFTAIIGGKKLKNGPNTSLSNCFPWVAWASNVNSSGDKTVFSVNEECIYISLPRTGAEPSKEEAENRVNELWQSVKDKVEFYAQLKMPVYEPLPEADQDAIKNLHSYYPNTTIECGAWTEVEYVADTKEFFLNQNQSLQKQILEIQNALISQKISGGV